MVKKHKKSQSAEQKARVAAKQTKKAAQKEKKAKSKTADESDAEDIDLESVLQEYSKQQAQYLKVTETTCEPPSPRSSATFIASPLGKELFLFGGEYFNGTFATFFNDLFIYQTEKDEWLFVTLLVSEEESQFCLYCVAHFPAQALVWYGAELPSASQRPDARSSFSFLPHDAGAVMCGGYSRTKCTVTASRQTRGGIQHVRAVYKPIIHQDTWFLRIIQPPADGSIATQPIVRWERRKKPANMPYPVRAGATMAYHKGRGILFGGVHDIEESEEGIDSEFFDALYAWNIEKNRFYPLKLRPRKLASKRPADDRLLLKRERGRADEAELLQNLALLDMKSSTVVLESKKSKTEVPGEEIMAKSTKPVLMTMPHPRFNAQLAVQDDVIYIFGGTYEHGDAEYTFDEMWAVDLGKLDGIKEIYRREVKDWQGSGDEASDSDGEGEQSGDEHDVEDPQGATLTPIETENGLKAETLKEDSDDEADGVMVDTRPQPRPFENLRDFFTRTSGIWQRILLEGLQQESQPEKTIKELRKDAFELADKQWWECREEITVLEDEQEEAGIGEVININDRGNEVGSDSRRH
ncbi:MAG: hypothetical protein Q9191_000299 [Dirinaria sp. TL-2023a]